MGLAKAGTYSGILKDSRRCEVVGLGDICIWRALE